MKDVEIQFNADEFLSAVQDIRDNIIGQRELTLRVTTFEDPEPNVELSE